MADQMADRPSLAEFLEARLAEDEAVAQDPRLYVVNDWKLAIMDEGGGRVIDISVGRVLAEVAAKRAIMKEHRYGHCDCRAVRILASVYADHPDYRDEWRP